VYVGDSQSRSYRSIDSCAQAVWCQCAAGILLLPLLPQRQPPTQGLCESCPPLFISCVESTPARLASSGTCWEVSTGFPLKNTQRSGYNAPVSIHSLDIPLRCEWIRAARRSGHHCVVCRLFPPSFVPTVSLARRPIKVSPLPAASSPPLNVNRPSSFKPRST
jgi:hypothetical protein